MTYAWIPKLLKRAGMCKSTSEARRLIKQGAVKINGAKVPDICSFMEIGGVYEVQVGKRKFKRIDLI